MGAAAAIAVREAERRDKEGGAERISIPKFRHNPQRVDTAVRPWPEAPYAIPRDVVELFRRGDQPPLIWLTVEGILDAGRRRQQLTFPLDKKSQDEVNSALARDALLPRAPFLAALGALAALFRAFQNMEELAEDEQDPATLIDELCLAITARASDEHWGLWRQYVRDVLAKIWAPRRDDELDFNVGKIDPKMLSLTEEAASVPKGRADDHSEDSKNLVTYLLTANRGDAETAAAHYEEQLKALRIGAFGANAAGPPEGPNWSAGGRPSLLQAQGTIALAVGEMAAVQSRASRTAHDEALIAAFRHPACVPLRQGAFEQALLCLSPSHQIRLARIPENVISGFSMGPLSLPTTTIIAPNHFRPDQLTIIQNWKDDALKKGFAAGPFRVEAIERLEGPIVTIPLTVVHTPATSSKPAKDRVCFNATWDPNKHLPEGTLPSVVGSAAFVYDYKEISSLIGSLVHTCAIFTARRSRLNALYAHRNRLHPKWRGHGLHLPRDVRRELKDWAHFLQTSDLSASFDLPVHTSSHIVYSDASNEGCGVVVDGQARFWPLAKQAHEAEVDIGFTEMWALHLALQTVVALGSRDSVVSFHVDNLGVVFAARKGRSRSKLTNYCLSDLALRARAANIVMSIVYVASADNLADAPSRGDVSAFAPLKVNLAEPWVDILGSATPNED
ncbi:hypothetical protein CF326_g7124 [Tilletia indica]|nr:hypothetical protein CF326_g7124 [Tilletia indica]